MAKAAKSEDFRSTPPDVLKTVGILAPEGSSIEQKIAAMRVAAAHHEAMEQRGVRPATRKTGRRQLGR
jgi:hypothetical protein